ncbi:MAG: DUF4058 family protein [Gemmataceae bacterium]|nr:DUF4058 family protein [Gemmataceae bacterium]
MPSPFPGMNPYLEHPYVWTDFRKSFIPAAAAALGKQLRPRYFTRITAAPAVPVAEIDAERISFLEIRHLQSFELVTVLELISRSHKIPGPGRDQYETRRRQLLATPVHLVEIDFLRAGPPLADAPACDYYVLVSRACDRPVAMVYPQFLPDPLPVVPIPLPQGEDDATLDLKQVIDRVYDAACYELYMYNRSPEPPLTPEHQEWAKAFVPQPVVQ